MLWYYVHVINGCRILLLNVMIAELLSHQVKVCTADSTASHIHNLYVVKSDEPNFIQIVLFITFHTKFVAM